MMNLGLLSHSAFSASIPHWQPSAPAQAQSQSTRSGRHHHRIAVIGVHASARAPVLNGIFKIPHHRKGQRRGPGRVPIQAFPSLRTPRLQGLIEASRYKIYQQLFEELSSARSF